MTTIGKIIAAFGALDGAPSNIEAEAERWERAFNGHEDRLRAYMAAQFRGRKWVPLETVATALGVELPLERRSPPGPMCSQWSEAAYGRLQGPKATAERDEFMRWFTGSAIVSEADYLAAIRRLNAARIADGDKPARLVGPARYQVEEAQREAWVVARSKGRPGLSREQEAEFAAYLADADRRDAEAGWVG
jgi:hypothetical protein